MKNQVSKIKYVFVLAIFAVFPAFASAQNYSNDYFVNNPYVTSRVYIDPGLGYPTTPTYTVDANSPDRTYTYNTSYTQDYNMSLRSLFGGKSEAKLQEEARQRELALAEQAQREDQARVLRNPDGSFAYGYSSRPMYNDYYGYQDARLARGGNTNNSMYTASAGSSTSRGVSVVGFLIVLFIIILVILMIRRFMIKKNNSNRDFQDENPQY